MSIELDKRNWELQYRIANHLWPIICEKPSVKTRREELAKKLNAYCIPCNIHESSIRNDDYERCVDVAVKNWVNIYESFHNDAEKGNQFIFEDGYMLIFFLLILWGNNTIILRGHYDSEWELRTSLQRALLTKGITMDQINKRSNEFLSAIYHLPFIRRIYSNEIPKNHQAALLQHYGFPTDYLDFTYSYDVALYFAEGGTDHLPVSDKIAYCGAIYAIPSNVLPPTTQLVSLPAYFLRPALQRGVFIGNSSEEDRKKLEKYKMIFYHRELPVWNGLTNVTIGSAIGLGKYLFPISDPLEIIKQQIGKDW